MTWETNPIIILREAIGDSESISYADERLKRLLAVAAYRVIQDVTFTTTYTITLTDGAEDISPDPNLAPDRDFINLIVLRAVIILLSAEFKSAASDAVMIKDGPSIIDLTKRSQFIEKRLQDARKDYEEYIKVFTLGKSRNGGVVTTPSTYESIQSRWLI